MSSVAHLCVSPEEEGRLSSLSAHAARLHIYINIYNEFLAFAPQFLQLHEEEGGRGEQEKGTIWLQFCYVATH